MRHLASIQKVEWKRPIEGRDRIELCGILGWSVICKKDEFQVGDRLCYIEIDSVLPEKPEFEFLRPKKFHIKTMKMAGVTSQGICFPLDILPEKYRCCDVGEDVTEILGVTQYEPTMDKEKDDYAGYKQKHAKKYPQFLMRFAWFRKLVLPKPRKGGFPSFISKTDEERCLDGDTKIMTEDGPMRIADICNKRINTTVLSWNETKNEFEYSRIIGYQKYPVDNRMFKIRYAFRPNTQRQNELICTHDHKLLTQRGYVCAADLTTEDSVAYPVMAYPEEVVPFVYGMLLGDAHLASERRLAKNGLPSNALRVNITHGEEQLEYLAWKELLLDESNSKRIKQKSGYTDHPVYVCSIHQDQTITNALYSDGCVYNGRLKINRAFCDRLTPLSLAVWYMDDGVCRHLNNEVYHNKTSASPSIEISTNSFDDDEVVLLSDMLTSRFGIENTIRHNQRNGKNYPSIYIPTTSTPEFLKIIAPYVPRCMRYKLFGDALKIDEKYLYTYQKTTRIFYDRIKSIDWFTLSKFSNNRYVYDIEVENNHNFVANGIVNHNCQNMPWIVNDKRPWVATEKVDGQSGTWALVRHKGLFRDKFEYIVCSRNLRLMHPDGSSYWQVSDKYQIENALKNMIGNNEWIAIQGECVGPKIQRNKYGLSDYDMYVFNLIYPNGRMNSLKAKSICENKGFNFVPIIATGYILPDTVDEILAYADGQSVLADTMREGIVFRSMDGKQSFKAVSNKFLLKWSE